MTSARDLLAPASQAFGKSLKEFINEWAEWCEVHGRAGHRHAKTIRDHLENAKKKASLNFVISLLDFLHTHSATATNAAMLEAAIDLCRTVLSDKDTMLNRYAQPLHSEPGRLETFFSECTGVYALCRSETSTGDLRQELLILREIAAKRKPERLATYISGELVFRGTWESVGNAVCVMMHGYRPGHKPDVANLFLVTAEQPREIMGGILSGLTTLGGRDPVFMPIIVIKIKNVSPHMIEIGNDGDEHLVAELHGILREMPQEPHDRLNQLADYFAPTQIDAKNPVLAQLTGRTRNTDELISQQLRDFCRDFKAN
jgi:hypothetical protein